MYLVMAYHIHEGWGVAAKFETEQEAREWANLTWINADDNWDDVMIVKLVAEREEIEKL